jgi:hypothetical protein
LKTQRMMNITDLFGFDRNDILEKIKEWAVFMTRSFWSISCRQYGVYAYTVYVHGLSVPTHPLSICIFLQPYALWNYPYFELLSLVIL